MKIEDELGFISECKSHAEEIKPIIDYMKEIIKEQIVNPALTGVQTQILKHKYAFMDELKQTIENAVHDNSKVEFKHTEQKDSY